MFECGETGPSAGPIATTDPVSGSEGESMFNTMRRLFWDLKHPTGRFNYMCAFLRDFPGQAGQDLRNKYIPRHFESAGANTTIHEGVRLRNAHKLVVGDGCEIGVGCFLQAAGGITLGNNVMLGPGAKIWSVNHRFDDPETPIREQGYDQDPVYIGDGCWLGANVFIMPGVHLPEGCVVSAGSVVGKKNYPPWSILLGYPARVMGRRKDPESG